MCRNKDVSKILILENPSNYEKFLHGSKISEKSMFSKMLIQKEIEKELKIPRHVSVHH